MITNLFSSFDPSTNSLLSLNWISLTLILIFINNKLIVKSRKLNKLVRLLINTLYNEFKVIILNRKRFSLPLIGLFLFIITNNFLGLFPYVFTSTRHMVISITIAFPIWLGLILFGWINFRKDIFAHLVPQSTPRVLIPFIVLIESTRNVIRPLTLSIRLSANIIAGHLLITLLGNQLSNSIGIRLFVLMVVQFILVSLEIAVSIIQSYVFSILITLYVREIGRY